MPSSGHDPLELVQPPQLRYHPGRAGHGARALAAVQHRRRLRRRSGRGQVAGSIARHAAPAARPAAAGRSRSRARTRAAARPGLPSAAAAAPGPAAAAGWSGAPARSTSVQTRSQASSGELASRSAARISTSVHGGSPVQVRPQAADRRPPVARRRARAARGRLTPALPVARRTAPGSRSGRSMPSAKTAASPGGSDTTWRDWSSSRFIVAPTSCRSSPAGSRCSDLERGVLDHVGDQLGRDLLGDHDALAVGADLGEQAGEQLDRVRAGALPAGPQQPVRLLQHDHVPQPARPGRSWPASAGAPRSG